jgi:hypothetical protein
LLPAGPTSERELFAVVLNPPGSSQSHESSGKRVRFFVELVEPWAGAEDLAGAYQPRSEAKVDLVPPLVPPGLPAFAKEDQELRYLVERVFVNLARLGYPDVRYPVSGEARGRLDLAGFTTSRALVLAVEGKAREKLGMRGTADAVAGAYNRCEGDSFLNQAQLFAGMKENNLVCGMATSSEMSYFFQCSDGRVRVAGPFMVAQRGYIRAVAWFLRYAEQRAVDRAAGRDPFEWPHECREKAARDPSRISAVRPKRPRLESTSLVPISAELLRTGRLLGHGRHGDVSLIV